MAEAKKVGDLTVNDGNGLLDNEGLIDTMILDCDNAVKAIVSGEYINFCNIMTQIVKKLANLRRGVHNDMASREEQIRNLQQALEEINKAEGE